MHFIFNYPELTGVDGALLDAGPVAEVARVLEDSGWSGLAFTEHPAPGAKWLRSGGHQTLDPFIALAHAAAVTERLTLLTYLSVAAYRNPLLLAKAAASVSIVSDGRFVLGLGAGYAKSEFYALGVDFEERGKLLDEALEVLPLHWRGEEFSYSGRHFEARSVMARPTPPPIPMWIGGNSGPALRRVATVAQGWIPLMGPGGDALFTTTGTAAMHGIDDVRTKIAEVRERAGERADGLSFCVPYDHVSAQDASRDAQQHVEAFADLAEAGATHLVINSPTVNPTQTYDFLRAFGETYA